MTDVTQTASDVADHAHEQVNRAGDRIKHAAQGAADVAADWRDRADDAIDTARDRAGDWLDTARDYVSEKPVQSVVIALAAGWLIGQVLRVRR